jgi:hypothetical protein
MEQTVNVRLPVSLWNAVQALALIDRRSASAELAVLVAIALADRNPITQDKPPCDQQS